MDAVKTLVENNASPNVAGQCGITPLIAAVVRGHTDLAELLLNWGGDLNSGTHEGITTLMAAVSNNPGAAPLLLKRGADINAADKTGITPLPAAAAVGKGDLVRLLVDPGADVQRVTASGVTALRVAGSRWIHGDREVLAEPFSGRKPWLARLELFPGVGRLREEA